VVGRMSRQFLCPSPSQLPFSWDTYEHGDPIVPPWEAGREVNSAEGPGDKPHLWGRCSLAPDAAGPAGGSETPHVSARVEAFSPPCQNPQESLSPYGQPSMGPNADALEKRRGQAQLSTDRLVHGTC
jgi:hypothetical protein